MVSCPSDPVGVAFVRTRRLDLLSTPLPFKTGMIVVALCPKLIAKPSWCFWREKANRESTPYDTAGALYSSKRSSDVTARQLQAPKVVRADSLAREKSGLARRSVMTMGCSTAESMPRLRKVKSSAFSFESAPVVRIAGKAPSTTWLQGILESLVQITANW